MPEDAVKGKFISEIENKVIVLTLVLRVPCYMIVKLKASVQYMWHTLFFCHVFIPIFCEKNVSSKHLAPLMLIQCQIIANHANSNALDKISKLNQPDPITEHFYYY